MVKKSRFNGVFRKNFSNKKLASSPLSRPPQLSVSSRGQPVFDVNLCVGCGVCSRDCPSKAIIMISSEGKKHPQFHLEKCVFCYQCADSCPKKAISTSAYYELATTDKSSMLVDPQICTYSIKIELDKKPQDPSDFGFYEKKVSNDR